MKAGIVAFCGAKGSGKSTSAELFKDIVDGVVEELAFAGHLKEVCSKVFQVDMKYFTDPKLKEAELPTYVNLTSKKIKEVLFEFGLKDYTDDIHVRPHVGFVFDTGRKLLQYIGTDLLHPIDKLIHVKITLKKRDNSKISLVTDVRFPLEFEEIAAQPDCIVLYVHNKAAEAAASGDTHASEAGWKLFKDRCVLLDNNGNLGNLTNNLREILRSRYDLK